MNSEYRIVEDPAGWDGFVQGHGGHLLQSAGWGELKSRFGWAALRVGLARDGELVAGAQVLVRRLPLGLRLAYVPRGPVGDASDPQSAPRLIEALCAVARARCAFALKLEPDAPQPAFRANPVAWVPGAMAARGGARPADTIQPHASIHIDLTCDLETILARMKTKWRYNIRLAERKGVSVRMGTASDMPAFYRLMQVTSARDHFAIHSLEYYRAVLECLGNHARLFLAEYEGEALGGVLVTAWGGEAIYLFGGSANVHRERMPNHALHWQVIQWAKARGCSRYDLWGVPDSVADAISAAGPAAAETVPGPAGGRLPQGIYQFKQGFGGQVVRYPAATDMVFSRAAYALYMHGRALRRGGAG